MAPFHIGFIVNPNTLKEESASALVKKTCIDWSYDVYVSSFFLLQHSKVCIDADDPSYSLRQCEITWHLVNFQGLNWLNRLRYEQKVNNTSLFK